MEQQTQVILDIIADERQYQDSIWGGYNHDKNHPVATWIIWMEDYLNKAKKGLYEGDLAALDELRKAVALGVACMEVHGCPKRKQK